MAQLTRIPGQQPFILYGDGRKETVDDKTAAGMQSGAIPIPRDSDYLPPAPPSSQPLAGLNPNQAKSLSERLGTTVNPGYYNINDYNQIARTGLTTTPGSGVYENNPAFKPPPGGVTNLPQPFGKPTPQKSPEALAVEDLARRVMSGELTNQQAQGMLDKSQAAYRPPTVPPAGDSKAALGARSSLPSDSQPKPAGGGMGSTAVSAYQGVGSKLPPPGLGTGAPTSGDTARSNSLNPFGFIQDTDATRAIVNANRNAPQVGLPQFRDRPLPGEFGDMMTQLRSLVGGGTGTQNMAEIQRVYGDMQAKGYAVPSDLRQQVENVMASRQGRDAVNAMSPTGLWTGGEAISAGNLTGVQNVQATTAQPSLGTSPSPAQPTTDFAKRAEDIVTAAEKSLQPGGTPAAGNARVTNYGGFTPTAFPSQAPPAPGQIGQAPATFTPTQAPTIPGRTALATRPAIFTPTAYNRPNVGQIDQNALQQRVEQELNVKYNPQREALLQAAERSRLAREQQTQEIEAGAAEQTDASKRQTAANMERAREYWGARNLGSSGFLAGTQAQAQAAAVRAQGGIARDTERTRAQILARGEQETSQLNQQLDTLASLRGEAGASRLAQLNTEERQFRLQEANQALGEWQAQMQVAMAASQQNQQAFDADRNFAENVRRSDIDTAFQQWAATNQVNQQAAQMARQAYESDRGFQENVRQFGINQALQNWLAQNKMALDQAQLGLSERQVGLAEERQSALLPGETARQSLLNRQTALEMERSKAMLPSDLSASDAAARRAGTEASAANEALYRSNEAYRKYGTLPQDLEVETAQLKRDAAKLEVEIARDPNVGSRAMKQAQLDEINARIRSSNALANQRNEPGGVSEPGGMTPNQQFQADIGVADRLQRARQDRIGSYTSTYNISPQASEAWVDFVESVESLANPTPLQVANLFQTITQGAIMSARDQEWFSTMYAIAQGRTDLRSSLDAFLKTGAGNDAGKPPITIPGQK